MSQASKITSFDLERIMGLLLADLVDDQKALGSTLAPIVYRIFREGYVCGIAAERNTDHIVWCVDGSYRICPIPIDAGIEYQI